MTWDRNAAHDGVKVRIADDQLRDNWDAFEDAFGREHNFVGDGAVNEGEHKPGECGIIFVGGSADIAAASVAKEGSGALAYDTDNKVFKIWNGSSWDDKEYLRAAGDTLKVDLAVAGEYIDGRDPSVDGAKLDNSSFHSNFGFAARGYVAHGGTVPLPDGFEKEDCSLIVTNTIWYDVGIYNWVYQVNCSWDANWVVTAQLWCHPWYTALTSSSYQSPYYFIVAASHTS